MRNKLIVSILVIIILCSCGIRAKTIGDDKINDNGQVIIKIAGSTSVTPVMKKLKEAFEEKYTEYSVEIQETGSTAGITSVLQGACDIGMSSRDIKEEEINQGIIEIPIALDGLAIIVNPKNNISDLSSENITNIYKGIINNWNEVGGGDSEIVVVSREEGSGTRGAFEELLNLEEEVIRNEKKYKTSLVNLDAIFENSTGSVKVDVSINKNAIGYISLGSLDDSVKSIKIDGVSISEENIKNKSYSIARPFIVCVKENLPKEKQFFIDYILSEDGQEIVSSNNFIKIID